MLYALPPQNNLLLFIIGLGVWKIAVLFGNLKAMARSPAVRPSPCLHFNNGVSTIDSDADVR
ncbi:MAG: hypothetical protein QXH07_04955 [Thermoplasmata archaeon]